MNLQDLNKQEYDKYPITNKTRQYLVPSLLSHGNKFKKEISQFSFVAAGLWDEENRDLFEPYTIGFLVNARKSSARQFNIEHVINNYYFGELLYGKLHMLVVRLPEQHHKAYDYFLKSEYSKMYDDPKSLFNGLSSRFFSEIKDKCISVCTNDNFYRTELAMELEVPRSKLAKELDSKIDYQKEVFSFSG